MVKLLKSTQFLGAVLITDKHLLEGGTYFDLSRNGAGLARG